MYKIPEEDLSTNGVLSTSKKEMQNNFEKYPVLKMSVRMPSMVFSKSIDFDVDELSDIDYDTPLSDPLKENLIEQN